VPVSEQPSNCLLALAACNKTFYPHIHVLLQIFASLPVSTATPERTFSAMKILKTYLRSRLTDENMQGLSMAYIHKDIHIDIEKVIDHFALKNRRLQLC
jgi:hAT family C-terminal dimerisation region